jgi:hypothetical protein
MNCGYDVNKQHSQSEMRAIPICHLSQLEMRWPEIRGEEHSVSLLVYCCSATILRCQFVSFN